MKIKNVVEITHNNGGYDITAYQTDQKVGNNWRMDFQSAYRIARSYADFYTDDNGQHLAITIPDDIVLWAY